MWVSVERIVVSCDYNVAGKETNKRYAYVIVIRRWFKRKVYLRLMAGWRISLGDDGEKVKVELTRHRGQAATFYDEDRKDGMTLQNARLVVGEIKRRPDKFILN